MATTNNSELLENASSKKSWNYKNEDDFFQPDPPQWAYEQYSTDLIIE